MLCEFCFNHANRAFDHLKTDDEEPEGSVLAHASLKDFQNAAKSGCWCCMFVWPRIIGPEPLDSAKIPDDTQSPLIQIRCTTIFARRLDLINFGFERESTIDVQRLEQQLPFLSSRKNCWYSLRRGPKPYEACVHKVDCYPILISQLQRWLHADGTQFPNDREPNITSEDGRFYPTRLIQIAQDMSRVHLVDTSNFVGTERYAALSHRWSQGNPFKCTSKTIESLRQGVPVTFLTRTFREVVGTTRDMGFSLLWIDSLCIVQDDREDWKRELTTMADVYRNAEFTFAVNTSGRDADVSFLGTVFQTLLRRTMAKDFPFTDSQLFPDDRIYLGSLGSRGWTLQERLLSRRVIHFLKDDVIFEGRINGEHTWLLPTAMIPTGERIRGLLASRDFLANPNLTMHVEFPEMKFSGEPWVSSEKTILNEWFEVVSDFRRRDLTYASDRLVAIDAIATAVAQKTGWTYFQGLWKEALPRCLLWYASNIFYGVPQIPVGRDAYTGPEGVKFPSWSWAACNNRVDYEPSGLGHKKRILFTAVAAEDSLPGAIRIYGQLCKVASAEMRKEGLSRGRLHINVEDQSYIGKIFPELTASGTSQAQIPSKHHNNYLWHRDSNSFEATTQLWFLPACAGLNYFADEGRPSGEESSWNRFTAAGLILQEQPGATNVYTRVGLAEYAGTTQLNNVGPLFELSEQTVRGEMEGGVSFLLV